MYNTESMWPLEKNQFIRHFYIQGPFIEDFQAQSRNSNQLQFEAEARSELAALPKNKLWEDLPTNYDEAASSKWNIYFEYGNDFIEKSSFYSTLKRIQMHFFTRLYSSKKQRVKMRVWSYMAVEIYLNGEEVSEIPTPVYKPIQSQEFEMELSRGVNILYGVSSNLGVRDTRNIIGIQLLECEKAIYNCLEVRQESIYYDTNVLERLSLKGSKLEFSKPVSGSTLRVEAHFNSPDYYYKNRVRNLPLVSGQSFLDIPLEVTNIQVHIENPLYHLSRAIEIHEHIHPNQVENQVSSSKENFRQMMEDIASIKSLNRGGRYGFSIMNILARKYCGNSLPEDRTLFLNDLTLIERRVDCSDFLVAGVIRYIHNYELDEELLSRIREVLLNYRYWMDMEGADGMCFWSENHSLMFYTSALFAGELYPDDFFPRANMRGGELAELSEARVLSWLQDVETYHLEEFLSADYSPVTIAPLLNLVDFAKPSISVRASKIIDTILEDIARHNFHGSSIAPMGRAYRSVIYPFMSSVQSLVHWMDSSAPWSFGEGWLAHLATSKYRLPENLHNIISGPQNSYQTTGNARIVLDRNNSYCLTSVESPREELYERWAIVSKVKQNEADIQEYVKSLNERFHGTTDFAPGVYGYQQHLWYAALTNEALIFVNHPGSSTDATGMRPGYWYGNGIMPAIKQSQITVITENGKSETEVGVIGSIYKLNEKHPIAFTHVFCPLSKFSETLVEEQWVFLSKGRGYLALWSSNTLIPHNDVLFDCEFRVNGRDTAYLCFAGKSEDFQDLEEFSHFCKSVNPSYNVEESSLSCANFELSFMPGHDETQYVM
jgi:hypothetical protein